MYLQNFVCNLYILHKTTVQLKIERFFFSIKNLNETWFDFEQRVSFVSLK